MRRTLGSMAGAGAVALLVMVSAVAVAAPPATAQAPQPTVTVTPEVVTGGDPVTVEFSGLPEGPGQFGDYTLVLICAADAIGMTTMLHDRCISVGGHSMEFLGSGSFEVRPWGTFSEVNCATVEGGCVIGVVHRVGDTQIAAQAWDSIRFYPTIDVTEMSYLEDGQTVTVEAEVVPPGQWQIAQCGRAYLDDPTPARAAQLCGPPVSVSAGPDATFAADVVVHDPLVPTAPGAAPIRCERQGCVLVVSGASVPVIDRIDLSFGQLRMTVTPSSGLADVATVEVAVEDWPSDYDRTARVAQCAYPRPGATEVGCGEMATITFDDSGQGRTTLQVHAMLLITSRPELPPGWLADCRVGHCAVSVFGATSSSRIAGPAPLQFASPPMTITPERDLLADQPMTVATSGLTPGQYRLDYCQPVIANRTLGCAPGAPVTVGSNGVLDVQVPARQRFTSTAGAHHYCAVLPCMLQLWSVARSAYVAQRGYLMASPNVTVSPNTGLRDGQSVQVSGNRLMSSYAGPTPASGGGPSGQWWLVQCNRNVAQFPLVGWTGEQHMWGLLLNCGIYYPPAVPATVPGSTLQAAFTVRSRIYNVLWEPTDCTASPGACLVGLVRLEQDGTLSRHLTPLTFGP